MCKKITRREFLKKTLQYSLGSACCLAAAGPLGNRLVHAQSTNGSGKILVMVNLFGGIDGLNWIVPYGLGRYYDRRPTLAIPESQIIQLNGQLGFHPAWSTLHSSIWQTNDMAILQKVGYPDADRSHFASQDIWTMGRRGIESNDARGWLGRLADLYFNQTTNVVGVGVGFQNDFLTDNASSRPTVVNSLEEFTIRRNEWMEEENNLRDQVIQNVFKEHVEASLLGNRAAESIKNIYTTSDQFQSIINSYSSSVTYPENNYLANHLQEIAKMIQGNLDTQVFYTGIGGWDHHDQQAQQFNGLLSTVNSATNAFVQDIKAMGRWDDICVVFFSEFGRNCFENGSFGTDHGHANNMVLMGGGVRGGIYGNNLTNNDINQDFLSYQIDFRSVFKSIIKEHLGLNPDPVFDETIPNESNLDLFI